MTPLSRREFTVSVLGAAAAATRVARATPAQTTSPKTSIGSSTSSPELLAGLTLADVSARVKAGTVTSTALVTACLARIDIYNPKVNAFITVMRDAALAQAKALDAEQRAGTLRGPLHGIPIALKDNIDTAGVRTTAASAVFDDRVPAEDAEVARRLAAAGAVVIGKTNLHEFAFGGTSATSYYGPVRNPWALERNPGGSSGGSAAAVATDLCYGALGTDTRGAIRTPASYCRVVGLKPTYGLISIRGIIPLTLSLDHCGPIARSGTDAAMLLNVLGGYDRLDIASVEHAADDYVAAIKQPVSGFRIGIARAPFFDLLDADVATVIDDALRVLPTRRRTPRTVDASIKREETDVPRNPELENTGAFNVYGIPAISVPCGFTSKGLPVGLMIAGPRFSEGKVLALAHAFEQATEFHAKKPPIRPETPVPPLAATEEGKE